MSGRGCDHSINKLTGTRECVNSLLLTDNLTCPGISATLTHYPAHGFYSWLLYFYLRFTAVAAKGESHSYSYENLLSSAFFSIPVVHYWKVIRVNSLRLHMTMQHSSSHGITVIARVLYPNSNYFAIYRNVHICSKLSSFRVSFNRCPWLPKKLCKTRASCDIMTRQFIFQKTLIPHE